MIQTPEYWAINQMKCQLKIGIPPPHKRTEVFLNKTYWKVFLENVNSLSLVL